MDRQKSEFVDRYSLEELMHILSDLVRRYTAGDSSSISYETGEMLMVAVRYTVNHAYGEGLMKGDLPCDEAYKCGHKLLVDKTRDTLKLYTRIMENFDAYGNIAYYDTMVKGMPEFFRWYDVDYCPQNTILMLDYPLETPIEGLQGIDMISAYLKKIEEEQNYLSKFPSGFVEECLQDYHFMGRELVINLSYVLKKIAE